MATNAIGTRGTTFKDASTECAICLSSLEDEETIELTCGHRWHFNCLKEQLEHAQPNHAKRILFSGCRCAKCGVFCDHESLRNLTRRTDALRQQVDALIKEQLQIDAPQIWDAAQDKIKLLDEGRNTYAFYLCNSCEEPYFGGTIECADQDEGELPTNDRLCPSCAPHSQAICRHPNEHRLFHIWKCRYCCNPANFVCSGTVHFCHDCHDRNSQRVREHQRPGATTAPPPLEPIPCQGGACQYPKAPGGQGDENHHHHDNGPSPSCEQLYHCIMCLSSPFRVVQEDPGSRNFVHNPNGEEGLRGWRQFARPWEVQTSEIPLNDTVTTNFVSSYMWSVMGQTVPLHQFVNDASSVRVEVSAKFMGRSDCPSVFRLEAIILNAERTQLARVSTPELQAPADFWERASLVLEPTNGAHEVAILVYGKDSSFWRGNFGSKVTECCVRVLGSEEELRQILRQDTRHDVAIHPHPALFQILRARAFDVLLPALLLLFVWLAQGEQ
ncbi:cupin-like domain-containing protein [Fragilaria crotonensis]|nr:cupin-like domain-containing protein [Fragilaria crotonensis]